ncbi:MAG TPA: sulfotransferase domain-containing protein [Chloroflexota bacterium]|nr:sulfotransferase domain-containing protein [Chloroflexota bacterium]
MVPSVGSWGAKSKLLMKGLMTLHRPDGQSNVFVFSLPRGGSTWLMELICTQPGFKPCSDPLNLREIEVRRHSGLERWEDLYDPEKAALLRRYFQGFCDGSVRFRNLHPGRANYRPLTRRVAFKMHACEDRINWFRDEFNGRVVLFLRHPIAVSLSRQENPILGAMLSSGMYRRHFDEDQLAYAARIWETGTALEQKVLAWCLFTAVALRAREDDWAVVTYEQLVLEPAPAIDYLARKLLLPRPAEMLRRVAAPSRVKFKSDRETQRLLADAAAGSGDERRSLVGKWRARVSEAEERRAMEIPERFGIDVYRAGDDLPTQTRWITSQAAGAVPERALALA